MIYTADNIDIARWLLQGKHEAINNNYIYNLTSAYSDYPTLYPLIANMNRINTRGYPINEFINYPDFDSQYTMLILHDPMMFDAIMRICWPNYTGGTVVLLVYHDVYRDSILEAISKFIHSRYGMYIWNIRTKDDIMGVKNYSPTPNGLLTMDADMNEYIRMCLKGIIPNPPTMFSSKLFVE